MVRFKERKLKIKFKTKKWSFQIHKCHLNSSMIESSGTSNANIEIDKYLV